MISQVSVDLHNSEAFSQGPHKNYLYLQGCSDHRHLLGKAEETHSLSLYLRSQILTSSLSNPTAQFLVFPCVFEQLHTHTYKNKKVPLRNPEHSGFDAYQRLLNRPLAITIIISPMYSESISMLTIFYKNTQQERCTLQIQSVLCYYDKGFLGAISYQQFLLSLLNACNSQKY